MINIYTKNIYPDLIKIDAESAEYEIIQGMKKILYEFKPKVIIEVGDKGVSGVQSSKNLILKFLELGYWAYELNNGDLVECKLRDKYGYENILFLPEKI